MTLPRSARLGAWISMFVLLGASLAACAQDNGRSGPLREWIKERRAQKSQEAPTPAGEASGKISTPGTREINIESGGIPRKYLLHVPKSYDPARPVPLLLSFHGGGGHMEYQADDERYGQISASEKWGFVIVFPNGYSRLGGRFATWNAGGCCGKAKEENIDDVSFVRQIVANVTQQLAIDRERIFATGFSNGAQLSLRLACEMADTFKAVAAVSGTDMTSSCKPSRPVSVLSIHARNDDHSSFDGGKGKKSVDAGNMANATSVPETISRWVARDRCDAKPQRVLDRPGAYCERYTGCEGGAQVALCVTERGTHSWPGAQKARSTETPSQAISANEVMWNFFLGRALQ